MSRESQRRKRHGSKSSRRAEIEGGIPEYFSYSHPEWWVAEIKFVAARLEKHPLGLAPGSPPVAFADLKYLTDLKQHVLGAEEDRSSSVYQAVRDVGLDILRPSEMEQSSRRWHEREEHRMLQEVRRLIWGEIERWYWGARRGSSPAERRSAATRLKLLGQCLAGDRRGHRGGTPVDPLRVREFHYRMLFRLERALDLLKVWPFASGPKEKVNQVAGALLMTKVDLHTYLRLDEHGLTTTRPLPPEHQVRLWTAELFGLDEPTVSNILAGRRIRTRK